MAADSMSTSGESCDTSDTRKASVTSSFLRKASATSDSFFRKVDSTRQRATNALASAADKSFGKVGSGASSSDVGASEQDLDGDSVVSRDWEKDPKFKTYRQQAEEFLVQEAADKELTWAMNASLSEAQQKTQFVDGNPFPADTGSSEPKSPASCMVSGGGDHLVDLLQKAASRVGQQLKDAEQRATRAELALQQVRPERDRLEKENRAFRSRLGEDGVLAALDQIRETEADDKVLIEQLLARINELESELTQLRQSQSAFNYPSGDAASSLAGRSFNFNFAPGRARPTASPSSPSSLIAKEGKHLHDPVPLLCAATQATRSLESKSQSYKAMSKARAKAKSVSTPPGAPTAVAAPSGSLPAACSSEARPAATPPASAAVLSERELISVQVDRSSGAGLGVELHQQVEASALTVLAVKPGQLISDWNMANPAAVVRPGDRIVRVNGGTGTSRELTQRIKDAKAVLALVLARGTTEEATCAKALYQERQKASPPAGVATTGREHPASCGPMSSTLALGSEDTFVPPFRKGLLEGAALDGEDPRREVFPRGGQQQHRYFHPGGGVGAGGGGFGVAAVVGSAMTAREECALASVPEEDAEGESHAIPAAMQLTSDDVGEDEEEEDEEDEDEDELEEQCRTGDGHERAV